MRRLLTVLLTIAGLAGLSPGALASSFYLTGDVPTVAGGPTRQPWEIVRYDTGVYSVALALPAGTAVQGLHRRDDGQWLFSVAVPTTLGGTDYGPRDIVLFNGAAYSSFVCGVCPYIGRPRSRLARWSTDSRIGSRGRERSELSRFLSMRATIWRASGRSREGIAVGRQSSACDW
jgi:hypothetical protein